MDLYDSPIFPNQLFLFSDVNMCQKYLFCSFLYISGSSEPRMKSHYRGHKMALWLNLIPQLHQSGGSDVAMLHHNFRDERPEFYEGMSILQ